MMNGIASTEMKQERNNDHLDPEEGERLASIRRQKDEVLLAGTAKLAAASHPSTKYPPVWMPALTWEEKLPKLSWIIFCLVSVLVFACVSIGQKTSQTTVLCLAGLFPFMIIFAALCVCSLHPLEHIEKLNFLATAFIFLGANINLLFGHSHFISVGVNEDLGMFFGTTILSFGTIIFSFCTFILGPWEFMAGSPLLAIGLLLRNCASFISLYTISSKQMIANYNLAACPFLFIALVLVGKKAYQLMRLPILSSDNYRFFGIVFYGGSIMANAILTIIQQTSKTGISEESYGFMVSITSSCAFFGTSIFLLDGTRLKHHCNAMIEDRYPSTTYLIRHEDGFIGGNCSCFFACVVNFASTLIYLKENNNDNTAAGVGEFITGILTALSVVVLCNSAFFPSLQDAKLKKEEKITKMLNQLLLGFCIFTLGTFAFGVYALISTLEKSDNVSQSILRYVSVVSVFGAIVLVVANWPMDETPAKVLFDKPSTWDNIFHPCNYVLLASIWILVGAVFKSVHYHAIGSLAYCWGFAILLLHFDMSFYVWESMNLPSSSSDEESEKESMSKKEVPSFVKEEKPEKEVDVLISGGGVSGLFLACILGKENVNVILCERRLKSVSDARFAVLNSASVEHMEDVLDPDLFEELVSRSLPENTHYGSMLLSGLGHPKARVFSTANSPPRHILMENLHNIDDWTESRCFGSKFASQLPLRVMQSHQEAVLKKQLARFQNVDLRCGWLLDDFHIDEDSGVTAKVIHVNEDEDGNPTKMKNTESFVFAKYIVGCDGPSSIVAKKLRFRFDGLLNLARTKSLLVKVPGLYEKVVNTVGNTHQYQIIRKNFGLGAFVAADPSNDLWNCLFVFGEKPKTASPEEITKQFLGTDNFTIVQNRQWYWNFFVARTFRKYKRAFLAGDSAHSWPPFGGLGGNTAYGDVINLGWKLALACKGQASELLLDSYATERRQQVLQTAMYVLRATPNPHVMKVLTSRAFYNRLYMQVIKAGWYHHNSGKHAGNHFAQSGIQFGVKLNFSPTIMREQVILPDDPTCDYNPMFRAGSRLLHLEFANKESTYSYLNSSGYTIFVIKTELIEAANELATAVEVRGVPVKLVVIPKINPEEFPGNRKLVAHLLSLENILVIRPDHIIAWRHDPTTKISIDEGASKITGFGREGHCLRESYSTTDDAETARCYQRWLTREFLYNQRPFKFRFPMSIPVNNVTKETAINVARELTKRKGERFTTSTKQGDEKYDRGMKTTSSSPHDDIIKPSGFERKGALKPHPMPGLVKLANEREARGEPVYNFAVGNPSLEPPQEILEELINLSKATMDKSKRGIFKYTHPAGIPQLRKYIAKEIGEWQAMPELSPDNIIVTPGAQSAIVNVFEALLQPGDHMLTQTPFYPSFGYSAELWGAETKKINFKENSFDIDIEHLEELAATSGKNLRVIMLCSPSNPSGIILKEETLKRIGAIAEEHSQKFGRDVWIVTDNTYRRLVFNEACVPPSFPFYKQSILISSFSKDLSLAGERIGYVVVNPHSKNSTELVRWITNTNDKLGNLSPPSLIQFALASVYEKHGSLPNLRNIYKERVDAMHKKLNAIGLRCPKPEGAFYLLPRLPDVFNDDLEFSKKLAEVGVLVVPGSEFGAKGYIRIAALPSIVEMDAACSLISGVLRSHIDAKERRCSF